MIAAELHAAAEKKRLERLAANEAAHPYEREVARERLAGMVTTGNGTDAWTNPEAICRWCARRIKTHGLKPDGSPLPRWEAGASLCPVVRDTGRNGDPAKGEKTYDRYFRTPTEDEAAQWRANNNAATTVRKPSKAEREADARERKARQTKIDV